jgi:hypothetical protein
MTKLLAGRAVLTFSGRLQVHLLGIAAEPYHRGDGKVDRGVMGYDGDDGNTLDWGSDRSERH